ncbi:MAG: hypothetical protein R3B68_03120 [Phycisphaerales bacterium]
MSKTQPARRSSPGTLLTRVVACAAVWGMSAAALAQNVSPPAPSSTDKPSLFTYLMVIVVGALVVAGNLIPSKRGHQD